MIAHIQATRGEWARLLASLPTAVRRDVERADVFFAPGSGVAYRRPIGLPRPPPPPPPPPPEAQKTTVQSRTVDRIGAALGIPPKEGTT